MGLTSLPKWAPWAIGGAVVLLIANKVSGGALIKGAASGAVDVASDIASGLIDGVATSVSPANENNVFNASAEAMYQGLSGSQGSIGGDYYSSTHNADGSLKWWAYTPTIGGVYALPAQTADAWEKLKSWWNN